MINFFWIVLLSIVISAIVGAIVMAGLYLFWDSINSFIIKRKAKKYDVKNSAQMKAELKDGGKNLLTNEKEVQKEDGQFRDYERLREEGLRATSDGERATKDENNIARQFSGESRDSKIDAIADQFDKPGSRTDETW